MNARRAILVGILVLVAVGIATLVLLERFPQYDPRRVQPESMKPLDRVGAWVGALCVIAIFSFIYRENPFYRTFEHILLGVSIGFGTALIIRQVLYEQWWEPMRLGIEAIVYGRSSPEHIWDACLIFSGFFGLLWYFQYSKKYLWLSRITIGVTAGAAAGLGIKRVILQDVPQITSTFKNIMIHPGLAPHLNEAARWAASAKSFLFLIIVCCVLYYFFFSFRRDTPLAKAPADMGRFFLMISFGAFFGNTFMTRVVILIDRVQFLLHDWLRVIHTW